MYNEGEIYTGEMPWCTFCMDGDHNKCPDLMNSDVYGLYACGCEDEIHYQ